MPVQKRVDDGAQVALYVDFDNIVMSRYDELHGPQSFRNDKAGARNPSALVRQRLAEARVDLAAIMDLAAGHGDVVLVRAYANWASPVNTSYAQDLLQFAFDLVQLFPLTGTKNGADIRMALDVVDDLGRYPQLGRVVVVAGDSDYVALAQRCRRLGRRVTGIGAANSVSRFWKAACDDFCYYADLPLVVEPARAVGATATAPATDRPGGQPATPVAPGVPAPRLPLPSGPRVEGLRSQLGLLPVDAAWGLAGERLCVRAMRSAWALVTEATDPVLRVPKAEIARHLMAAGADESGARRAAHQVSSTGLPAVVRDATLQMVPNPELTDRTDDELLSFLRQWTAHRVRLSAGAGAVDGRLLAAAVHGPRAPEEAIHQYDIALGLATYPEMQRHLGPRLLAPGVLWDVAEALVGVPPEIELSSAHHLVAHLQTPLQGLERELDLPTAASAHLALAESGVLGKQHVGEGWGGGFAEPADVVSAVLRDWVGRLGTAGLLHPDHPVSRESFYRLALPDRYQVEWRAWMRGLLLDP